MQKTSRRTFTSNAFVPRRRERHSAVRCCNYKQVACTTTVKLLAVLFLARWTLSEWFSLNISIVDQSHFPKYNMISNFKTTRDTEIVEETATRLAIPETTCLGKPYAACIHNGNSTGNSSAIKRGWEQSQHFYRRPAASTPTTTSQSGENQAYLHDNYITLWLHQVHRWFVPANHHKDIPEENRDNITTKTLIADYLKQAQQAGFTSVMGDLPFEWTERTGPGEVDLMAFGKDWMSIACELGMSLHVVITMRDIPPWLHKSATSDFFEHSRSIQRGKEISRMPSPFHPTMWEYIQNYTTKASRMLVETYGTCVKSISPTLNNEFETRYSQTNNAMRDYSPSAIRAFAEWQMEKMDLSNSYNATSGTDGIAPPPPLLSTEPSCKPVTDNHTWNWFGFREEILASKYEALCRIIHHSSASSKSPNCLLHFGEFYSTMDYIHSNLFFKLAQSPYVDELVMDSNMALSGAPSSPSIVGILVSTARAYGKIVHYEAATERILACNDEGQIIVPTNNDNNHEQQDPILSLDWNAAGPLLLKSGIESALHAGVDSIGITNLCLPSFAGELFRFFQSSPNPSSSSHTRIATALPFQPTAVIYAPYRAFFAWHWIISNVTCQMAPTPCWHDSLDDMPRFGLAIAGQRNAGTCPVDVAQDTLIQVYDELRTRHAQVAVIGDAEMLTDDLLLRSTERVIMHFPCIMDHDKWLFYQGEAAQRIVLEKMARFDFVVHVVDRLSPGNCTRMA